MSSLYCAVNLRRRARSGTSGSGRSSATRPGSPVTGARSSAVTVISEIVSIPALGEVSSYWRGGCLTSGWQRGLRRIRLRDNSLTAPVEDLVEELRFVRASQEIGDVLGFLEADNAVFLAEKIGPLPS